jgi:RNA polymerase sigma-70 factor (ECF subfamily)
MKAAEAAKPRAAVSVRSKRIATVGPSLPDRTSNGRPSSKINGCALDDIRLQMIRFLPRLRRFAQSLTRDRERSEDLVQETCVRALARSNQWKPDTRLDSWMYRIAQNLWIDQMRAEKVKGEVVDIAAAGDISGCDGRAVIESRSSLLELRKEIARLPSDQRALLSLVCIRGLSYKEAAHVLESPAGTVMSRLARARRALNDAVNR